MKHAIVWALIRACELTDQLRLDHITHRHRLAEWSNTLDEQWNTGIWHETNKTPNTKHETT